MKKRIIISLVLAVAFGTNTLCFATQSKSDGRPKSSIFFDIESSDFWMNDPGASSGQSFAFTTTQKYSGKGSLALNYTFGDGAISLGIVPKDYNTAIPVTGTPNYFGAWIYGDNSGNKFCASVKDMYGEMFQFITYITWNGWKYVEFYVGKPYGFYGSTSNGRIDYPMKIYSFNIVNDNASTVKRSTVYFDAICVSDKSLAVEEIDYAKINTYEYIAAGDINIAKHLQIGNSFELANLENNENSNVLSGVAVVDNSSVLSSNPTVHGVNGSTYCLIDDKTSTYYQSKSAPSSTTNQWVTIDMGSEKSSDEIVITPAKSLKGFPVDYDIEISSDGETWTKVSSQRNVKITDNKSIDLCFERTKGRYVRLNAIRLSEIDNNEYALCLAEIWINDYFDINYADYNNGGRSYASEPSVENIPAGYFEFYQNAKAVGNGALLIKHNDNMNYQSLISNLSSVKADGCSVLYYILNEDHFGAVKTLDNYVDVWLIPSQSTKLLNYLKTITSKKIGLVTDGTENALEAGIDTIVVEGNSIDACNKYNTAGTEVYILYNNEETGDDYKNAVNASRNQINAWIANKKTLWNATSEDEIAIMDNEWKTNSVHNVLSNLSNSLSGFSHNDNIDLSIIASKNISYGTFTYESNNIAVAYWNNNLGGEQEKIKIDVECDNVDSVSAVDPYHGVIHRLNYISSNGHIIVEDLITRDFPVIIKLNVKNNGLGNLSEYTKHKLMFTDVLLVNSNMAVLNGKKNIIGNGAVPFVENNVLYLPIRILVENMGYEVTWNNVAEQITISNSVNTAKYIDGGSTVTINDSKSYFDNKPIIKNNTMYWSVDIFESVFDRNVLVDKSGLVLISTQKHLLQSGDETFIEEALNVLRGA